MLFLDFVNFYNFKALIKSTYNFKKILFFFLILSNLSSKNYYKLNYRLDFYTYEVRLSRVLLPIKFAFCPSVTLRLLSRISNQKIIIFTLIHINC